MKKKWYKLDNVGKFYSFTSKSKIPAVFRYSVTLNDKIEPEILQKSLDFTLKQYPHFQVQLKKGFFWYYLENTNKKVIVEKENLPICFRLYKDSTDVLFRVNYYNYRINFEVSHMLTDGRGSLSFFKAIIYQYIKLKYNIENMEMDDNSSIPEKTEDSFDKYYNKTKKVKKKNNKIYKYKAKKGKRITYIEYHLPTDKVLDLAHHYNSTLTSLLISVLILAYKKEMKDVDLNKTIQIDVPVDLRQFLPSNTSKNFFGLTSVYYKFASKEELFENVIKSVEEQLKKVTSLNELKIRVNKMISFEKNIVIRFIPLFIKTLVLQIIDKISFEGCTSCLSNIGIIKTNDEVGKYIKDFNVLNTTGSLKLTICSYKNDLSIGISSKYENNQIVKNFCNFFAEKDIEGTLNINMEGQDYEV